MKVDHIKDMLDELSDGDGEMDVLLFDELKGLRDIEDFAIEAIPRKDENRIIIY